MAKKVSRSKGSGSSPTAELVHLPQDMLKQAKQLLTGAEKAFFDSSFGQSLARATRSQVQSAVKQARSLRDKWRDLYHAQARSTKQQGRPASGTTNARTRAKHDLFAAAVERFERRLAELTGLVAESATPAPSTNAAHGKTTGKPAPRRPRKPAAGMSKKARRAGTLAGLTRAADTQTVRLDVAKQRSALTAAKAGRLRLEGLGTRRIGHAVARGRRSQARRDTRSRS